MGKLSTRYKVIDFTRIDQYIFGFSENRMIKIKNESFEGQKCDWNNRVNCTLNWSSELINENGAVKCELPTSSSTMKKRENHLSA